MEDALLGLNPAVVVIPPESYGYVGDTSGYSLTAKWQSGPLLLSEKTDD